MKTSRILLTLLSVAAIGLSSTAVMADGEGDLDRTRLRLSDHWRNVELSPELEALVQQFREQRHELMAQFREFQQAHREAMSGLWQDLKAAKEAGDETAFADAMEEIQKARQAFREEYGQDIRDARLGLRDLKRQFREEIRKQRETIEGEG
jgi:predicted negative regulator of RcsB-dependent stress response